MRLLSIGGNGHYAGRVTALLSRQHEVTVFDPNPAPCQFPCTQVTGSVLDQAALQSAAQGAEAVITFFVGDAELSTAGMVNVMSCCEQVGISHVVYTSSGGLSFPVAAYDPNRPEYTIAQFSAAFWESYFPIDEEAGMFPGNEHLDYFRNKWLCETIGRHFAARGRVRFTAMRPGLLVHDDMTTKTEREGQRAFTPFFMLMTGQIRMCDLARMYELALSRPPDQWTAYNCSNDTPFNNLSVAKAQHELGYRTQDQAPYLELYRSSRMDWKAAYRELVTRGIPAQLLGRLTGFV